MTPTNERSVIVTGAASGIGRAIAERLLADGFQVLAVDLEPADDTPGEPFAADLTTREGNRGALVAKQIGDQARAHGLPEERVLEDVILQPHAVKRLIEPAEVAGVVAFLLGPDGRAFTGAPVTMDLGWTAR